MRFDGKTLGGLTAGDVEESISLLENSGQTYPVKLGD